MTAISTHVLDTAAGHPASGIPVVLDGATEAVTDADGRARLGDIGPGQHRLVFTTGGAFFGEITVEFTVSDEPGLHVPVLLSPYGYTVYRGS